MLQHSDSKTERIVCAKREEIYVELASQGVSFSEITTRLGKEAVYEKFGGRRGKHPLFLVLDNHPDDYVKGDELMVVEWGKWSHDPERLKDDLMAFVNFFSDPDFRTMVARGEDTSSWKAILKHYGPSLIKGGITAAVALL